MTRGATMLLGLAIYLAGLAIAIAHSWYPLSCCSEKDCFPVEESDVKVTREGYRLKDGTLIPYSAARPSPDGLYHVCRYQDGKGALIRLEGQPACFWAPMGAS